MNNIYVCALMTLLMVSCGQKKDDNYTLFWADEFNGTQIDTTIWNLNDDCRGGGNAEMQYYTPNNATIGIHPLTGESCLILSARRENYKNRPATSARLNTQGKFAVQYGRIEARIAFPYTANGLWPAFWMLGDNLIPDLGNDDSCEQNVPENYVVWPKCGEIDIVEMGHKDGIVSGSQDRYFNGACHWGESFNNGAYPNCAGVKTADYPIQGSFHLFTLDWSADSIAMYLDKDIYPEAEPYFALSLRDKSVGQPGCYFNHPFYFVLNLSVGGFFPGLPSQEKYPEFIAEDDANFQLITALPQDGSNVNMYVDYIRVYKYNE